ncbi:hypothetical protein Purlil1_950 [Purpureocillium lilacinum]|uniref:Zn(2)-C6 fungal-type domain-containing protein n=1 Tax=Purpureocillium lilacinum TaxID=33203 RepID=A0ABR0CDG7_PURLI|nr:hypothetical protein Purlil1_950 [Purpureocillium lilacinum]
MLNKTCQTCFRAKIRCVKSQSSGLCDRCLRLDKPCRFAASRRPAKKHDAGGDAVRPVAAPSTGSLHSACPFGRGLLSRSHGSKLVDIFRTKLVPHFPFVVVPTDVTEERPLLHLAVLSAASFDDVSLQRRLGTLFSDVVAKRLASGPFATLDMLEALLVHCAWTHYQPKPRNYSQYLSLAVSIVTDLRMDRPRNPLLWSVETDARHDNDWGPEEVRAVAGAYYLASSSSMLLQKARSFAYMAYLGTSCRNLALQSAADGDKYLPYIVEAQRIAEGIDALTGEPASAGAARLRTLNEEYAALKSSVTFPLSNSPPLIVLMNMLELLMHSAPGTASFNLAEIRDSSLCPPWLLERIHAVRLMINTLVTMAPGDEYGLSNIEWITMHCALSLAARMDIVAASSGIGATQARRALDMPHSLKQVLLRLESASDGTLDQGGDHDPFHQLARRVRRLEEWHLARLERIEVPVASPSADRLDSLDTNAAHPLEWTDPFPGQPEAQPADWLEDYIGAGFGAFGMPGFALEDRTR